MSMIWEKDPIRSKLPYYRKLELEQMLEHAWNYVQSLKRLRRGDTFSDGSTTETYRAGMTRSQSEEIDRRFNIPQHSFYSTNDGQYEY